MKEINLLLPDKQTNMGQPSLKIVKGKRRFKTGCGKGVTWKPGHIS